jgi:hypothetical protein
MGASHSKDQVIQEQGNDSVWSIVRSVSDENEQITAFEHVLNNADTKLTTAATNAKNVCLYLLISPAHRPICLY